MLIAGLTFAGASARDVLSSRDGCGEGQGEIETGRGSFIKPSSLSAASNPADLTTCQRSGGDMAGCRGEGMEEVNDSGEGNGESTGVWN